VPMLVPSRWLRARSADGADPAAANQHM